MEWVCVVTVVALVVAGHSTLALAVPRQTQASNKPVMTSSADFQAVTKTMAFVDKTLLLGELLSDGFPCPTLVTAPQGFGKTTNLDMMRSFLSIPLDDKGQRVNPNLTGVHQMFTKTNIYKDNQRFFYRYFGQFPVIYIDFKTVNPIGSLEEFIDVLKQKIHFCFRRFPYLGLNSNWVDKARYEHFSKDEVLGGLDNLVDDLYRYFDETKVVLLIDNYDSLVTAAMMTVDNTQMRLINKELFGLLTKLISNDQVKWSLVTGVLPIDCSDSNCLVEMDKFKFLDLHPLGDYFGFLEDEVTRFIQNKEFNLEDKRIKRARIMYKPYMALGGKKVYCPNSILKFLKKKKAMTFWDTSLYLDHLMTAYKDPQLENTVDELLQGKNVSIKLQKSFNMEDVLMLSSMLAGRGTTGHSGTDLLLNYLFHTGYLTRCADPNKVQLPNHEIKETILEYLWNAHTVDVSRDAEMAPFEQI